MDLTIPKGSGPPPHTHDWDEAYYITAREVQFTVGDQRYVAVSGDFLYTPAGVAHGFRRLPQQAARMLIYDAPPMQAISSSVSIARSRSFRVTCQR